MGGEACLEAGLSRQLKAELGIDSRRAPTLQHGPVFPPLLLISAVCSKVLIHCGLPALRMLPDVLLQPGDESAERCLPRAVAFFMMHRNLCLQTAISGHHRLAHSCRQRPGQWLWWHAEHMHA